MPPSASRYLKLRRNPYRGTVVLLSILVIAAAGYILLRTEAAYSVLKAWNIVLPNSGGILPTFAPSTSNTETVTGTSGNTVDFSLAHDHGLFRGTCRGILSLNSRDVAFRPASGPHVFRVPFSLLKLKVDGKILRLYHISDDIHFQTFEAPDFKTADKFRKKWDELKAVN